MRARRRSSGCGAMGLRLVAPGRPNRPEAADPFTWASPPSVRIVWARPAGQTQDNADPHLYSSLGSCPQRKNPEGTVEKGGT